MPDTPSQSRPHAFVNLTGTFELGSSMKTQIKSSVAKWSHNQKPVSSLDATLARFDPIPIRPLAIPELLNKEDKEQTKQYRRKKKANHVRIASRSQQITSKARMTTSLGSRGNAALCLIPSSFNAPPNAASLLTHYCDIYLPGVYDLQPGISLSTWAIGDNGAVSFRIQMCMASAHIAKLKGQEVSRQSLECKSQALVTINKNLQEPYITDQTLMGVIGLCAFEHILGSIETWDCHIQGLSLILKARGGFASLDPRPKLQILLSCLDTMLSCILNREPVFVLCPASLQIFVTSTTPNDTSTLQVFSGLDARLRGLAHDLSILADVVPNITTGLDPYYGNFWQVRKMVNSLTHRLLTPCSTIEKNYQFKELCRAAMITHMCSLMRPFCEFRWVWNEYTVKSMRDLLSKMKLNWIKSGLRDLKLWLLFLGFSVSRDSEDAVWFKDELKKFVPPNSYMSEWEDILPILKQFWWAGKQTAAQYAAVYKEVYEDAEADEEARESNQD